MLMTSTADFRKAALSFRFYARVCKVMRRRAGGQPKTWASRLDVGAPCLAIYPRLGTFAPLDAWPEWPLMSLVVKLEDDLGERSEWVILHGVIPDHETVEFPILSCIDPFGKTVFN